MCVLCRYVEHIALNEGSHLISSAEGVQREVGVSLPLGVVATATKSEINSCIYLRLNDRFILYTC